MLKLIIEDDEGRRTIVPFVRDEISIGRSEGNTVRLTERNVSRRHARLTRKNGSVQIEDLGSYTGVKVNGKAVTSGPVSVRKGDRIAIGDYKLAVAPEGADGQELDDVEHTGETVTAIRPDDVGSTEVTDGGEGQNLKLVVVNGPLAGKVFACDGNALQLGRAKDCDLVVPHRSVAKRHAALTRDEKGRWQIRLLETAAADGLAVNGVRQPEASLRMGDSITLGKVRLRLVAAGREHEVKLQRRASIAPVLLMAMIILAGGGAVVAVTRPDRIRTAVTWARAVVTRKIAPGAATALGGDAAKIQEAKTAIESRDFRKAVALLEETTQPDGSVSAEAALLLAQAQGEQLALRQLTEAQQHLEAGRWDEAAALVAQTEGSRAFAREREALKQKLEASKKPLSSEVQRICDEGAELLELKYYKEAEARLRRCVELDPEHARCHKLLGTTYARLQEPDRGANHYRRFLSLAPNDPQADAVKKILESYEQSLKK